jgi:hypothetical protein
MTRRFTLFVTTGLLAVPGLAVAYYPPGYGPPRYAPCPPVTYVCPPPPVVECPSAMTPPAKPLAPPKVMEKPDASAPKEVKPAAAAEPMPMKKPEPEKKVDAPKQELPKSDLAIPSPAVPEIPEKPKPKAPEPAPFTLPPIDAPKKKDDSPPKLDLPSAKLETPPKVDVPSITLPPTTIVPVKAEEKKESVPEIVLPKISESKYLPTEPKVRVIPVEGKRSAGDQTVNLYNYTDRDLQLQVGGKATKLPAKSLLALTLPDSFAWKFGEKAETITIPADAAGLSIIIQ